MGYLLLWLEKKRGLKNINLSFLLFFVFIFFNFYFSLIMKALFQVYEHEPRNIDPYDSPLMKRI